MTGYDGRGAQFPLTIPRGSDVGFTVTATDSGGSAIDLATATITGNVYTTAGTVAVVMTDTVGGTGNNVISLSLSDTQTTALTSTAYRWALIVTRGSDTGYWIAGPVTMVDASAARTSNGANATLVVDEDVNVAVAVAAIGAAGAGTNLSWTAATSVVASDTGTDATLTVADGTNPGLMSSAHYTKLNTIDADITTLSLPANTTITAFGASLVDDADQATARATLGLTPGTNVQAYDADLADIAAISDVQGDIIVRGASGWERLAKSATATDVLTAGATQPAWAAAASSDPLVADFIISSRIFAR